MDHSFKVSNRQFFWMFATAELSMTIWLTITPALEAAHQDAWIAALIGTAIGVSITLVMVKLSSLYPKQTLVEYSRRILGKWFGTMAVIPFLIAWYSVSAIIIRDFADFIHLVLFHKTPNFIIITVLLALMTYVVYQGGIEAIAHISELTGPIIFFTVFLSLFLSLTNHVDFHRLLPVYSLSGYREVLSGGLAQGSFLGESMMFCMLLPFASDHKKAGFRVIWAVLVASTWVLFAIVMVIATFGPNVPAHMLYPYFSLVRYISLMDFIQNMDIFVIVIWIFSVYIKMGMYVFILSYGTAELLFTKYRRKMVWFVVGLLLVSSLLPSNSVVATWEYPSHVWIPWVFPVDMVALPAVLFVVYFVKRIREKRI